MIAVILVSAFEYEGGRGRELRFPIVLQSSPVGIRILSGIPSGRLLPTECLSLSWSIHLSS